MSTRNYAKGAKRHAANMGRSADAKHSVKIREGKTVRLGLTGTTDLLDPARLLAFGIRDALDPTKAPSKPKTWAQMTESERAEMRRLYEGKR